MPRTVILVVYHSPVFPAHWSLFLPHSDDENVGTLVHAAGDVKQGFETQFSRNYNIQESVRSKSRYKMPQVADEYITDVKGDGSRTDDKIAHNEFEKIALRVETPGPSLRSVSDAESSEPSKPKKVNLKNCQTWLDEVVRSLVEHGVMAPESQEVIEKAPKH